MKKALILGITGQDGSYLADILLERGYEVWGMVRRSSTGNLKNIQHIINDVHLLNGDMGDPLSVDKIIRQVRPDEIYNEADQDHVGFSFDTPAYSGDITGAAVGRLLEIVRTVVPKCKVFIPLSATMFGDAPAPQNEYTPFNPQSPYAVNKVGAYYWTKYYHKRYDMFVCSAILYNHGSVRRTGDYLLHKIARQVVSLKAGKQNTIKLGSFSMAVDVGSAREYMEAAWRMMQLSSPWTLCLGTGQPFLVQGLVIGALQRAGVIRSNLDDLLEVDTTFQSQNITLTPDTLRAKTLIDWSPKVDAMQLISELVNFYGEKQ